MTREASILERFGTDFGVPFLLGQRAAVSSPLGVDGLVAVRHGLSVHTGLADACARQLEQAALFADLAPAPFDEEAGTLLYAVYELFACTHPQASAFYARAHSFARAATREVSALSRTLDPHRLLTRHLIVGRAFAATRTDVFVKWWSGSAAFYGEDATSRLTAWPSVRRVDIDRRTTPMWKLALAGGNDVLRMERVALLTALLDASPLTRLSLVGDPVHKALGFSLLLPYSVAGQHASPLDVLDDRALARGVVDQLLERGLELSGSALAVALLQGVRERAPPRVLRRAAELCTHLALTACLLETEAPGAPEGRDVRSLLDVDSAASAGALRVFWSVVASTVALDGVAFELPQPIDFPYRTAELWGQMRERLTHPRIASVAEPLTRELRRHLLPLTNALPPAMKEARPLE